MGRLDAANGARLPVEWDAHDGKAVPIAIEQFDFEALDSLRDRLLEALDSNDWEQGWQLLCEEIFKSAPLPVLERMFRRITRLAMEEAIKEVIATCIAQPNPKEILHYLAAEIGHSSIGEKSLEEVAREFGKRKQAAYQAMEQFAQRTGIRILRPNARNAQARAKMRARNFRHRNFFRSDLLKRALEEKAA